MTSVRQKQVATGFAEIQNESLAPVLPIHQNYRHVLSIGRIYLSTRIQPNMHRPTLAYILHPFDSRSISLPQVLLSPFL